MIKATGLQIGDYVLVEGKVRRVESITKRKIGFHINEEKKRLYYARLCEVFPIEINDYILRTSGFCLDETEERTLAHFDNDKMRIDVFLFKKEDYMPCEIAMRDKETYSCYVGGLRFVHQLQHAIRLCGIDFEVKL